MEGPVESRAGELESGPLIRVSFKSLILLSRDVYLVPSLAAKGNRSTRLRKVQQAQGRRCIQYVYP